MSDDKISFLLNQAVTSTRLAADELYKANLEDARARQLDRIANSIARVQRAIRSAERDIDEDASEPLAVTDGATVAVCSECDVLIELTVLSDDGDFTGVEMSQHWKARHA